MAFEHIERTHAWSGTAGTTLLKQPTRNDQAERATKEKQS